MRHRGWRPACVSLHTAIRVELKSQLTPFQCHRAAAHTTLMPQCSQCPKCPQILQRIKWYTFAWAAHFLPSGAEGAVYRVIVQLCTSTNDRSAEQRWVTRYETAVTIQRELHRKRQPIAVRQQRAKVLTQPSRQHRVHLAYQVHRCG